MIEERCCRYRLSSFSAVSLVYLTGLGGHHYCNEKLFG